MVLLRFGAAFVVATLMMVALAGCPRPAAPLPVMARPVDQSVLPIDIDDWFGVPQTNDSYYQLPALEDRVVFVRSRPQAPLLMFATSCSVLTSVSLPKGWDGLCRELVHGGGLEVGPFTYEEASSQLSGQAG